MVDNSDALLLKIRDTGEDQDNLLGLPQSYDEQWECRIRVEKAGCRFIGARRLTMVNWLNSYNRLPRRVRERLPLVCFRSLWYFDPAKYPKLQMLAEDFPDIVWKKPTAKTRVSGERVGLLTINTKIPPEILRLWRKDAAKREFR